MYYDLPCTISTKLWLLTTESRLISHKYDSSLALSIVQLPLHRWLVLGQIPVPRLWNARCTMNVLLKLSLLPLQTFKSLFPPTLLRMEMGQGGSRYNVGNWPEQKRREKGRKFLLSGQWRKDLMTTFVYAMQAYKATLMNAHSNHYSSCNYHCIIPHINKYKLFWSKFRKREITVHQPNAATNSLHAEVANIPSLSRE